MQRLQHFSREENASQKHLFTPTLSVYAYLVMSSVSEYVFFKSLFNLKGFPNNFFTGKTDPNEFQ